MNHSNDMADPYGISESEDMSSFLQILLQNSSASASTANNSGLFCGLEAPASVAKCSSSIKFSDPRIFLAEETDGNNPCTILQNSFPSYEEYEACESSENRAPLRSSKRSRAAEDHNLSEKRRRSRINEKLKALQSLIPNSNKADKASMLDEAIEYLKQLQLQVQTLTMRNGLSLHPGYSLGSLQSMLVPSAGLELDEGNMFRDANRDKDTLSRDNNVFMQSAMENINLSSSTQSMLIPSMSNNTNSRILPSIVPSVQKHYGLLNHLAISKDICQNDTVSQLQLDRSCSRNNSSPGVSSS